jgi:hypothetical protein
MWSSGECRWPCIATGEERTKNDSGGEGTVHVKDIARIRKRARRRAAFVNLTVRRAFVSVRCTAGRQSNDVRIDCKAAKHSDGDRGTPPADLGHRTAGGVPTASADCSSRPTGRRANKRRFVNLLQQLGRSVDST